VIQGDPRIADFDGGARPPSVSDWHSGELVGGGCGALWDGRRTRIEGVAIHSMNARSFKKPSESAATRKASGVLRIDSTAIARHRGEESPEQGAAGAHVKLTLGAQAATLLLACPSARDMAPSFVTLLSGAGARVLDSEQHTDADSSYVFQRVRSDISRVPGGSASVERLVGNLARPNGMTVEVERAEQKKRVAVFVSKYDHCLYDLLLRHQAGDLDCHIPVIVSNHPDLGRVAGQFGVEYKLIEKNAANKARAEDLELALLDELEVDLVVLARYMQVLSDKFVARFERRVINIHHSFLPAFIGAKPYHQAQERGVKLIGATAHYASATLDQGPIIEQDVVRCSHKDTIADLVRKGRDLERQVLARAVGWHLDDRVIVHGNKTVIFD
jgi:formyltetrahydrofolate deformylase